MLGNLICWDLTSQLPDHFALCLLWSVQNFKMIVLWMKEISWDLSLIWISERYHINGLVQERRNSIANTLELVFLALMHWYSVTSELCIAGLLWGNPLDPSPPPKKKKNIYIYIYHHHDWTACQILVWWGNRDPLSHDRDYYSTWSSASRLTLCKKNPLVISFYQYISSGLILGFRPANERCHY